MKKQIIIMFYCITTILSAKGYLYPVGSICHDGIQKMCVLYQKQNGFGLELYIWDPLTHVGMLGLLTFFQPTSVAVLPGQHAFSFIDNDKIRIKEIDKRSPRSLDFYGPYDLTTIHWIDDTNFYFSAKERRHNNLFHATIQGDLVRLTVSNSSHYLYPCKIDDTLFFIEHASDGSYFIKNIPYPSEMVENRIRKWKQPISLEEELKVIMREEENYNNYEPILDLSHASVIQTFKREEMENKSIAFLSMVTPYEGFFIQHSNLINYKYKFLECEYWYIHNKDNKWDSSLLFTFVLPLNLIIPQKHFTNEPWFNESILPFLPYYYAGLLYFSSYDRSTNNVNLYSYDMVSTAIKQIAYKGTDMVYCSPQVYNGQVLYGGTIEYTDTLSLKSFFPQLALEENGFYKFHLPSYTIS